MSDPAASRAGALTKVRGWAVGSRTDGTEFAVSARCRHQLADLSRGSIDADGCLVCPWHGARYDTTTGRMVEGPRGVFGYHGPTPGYTQLIAAVGRVVRLAVGRVHRDGAKTWVERVGPSPLDPRTWLHRS